MINGYHPFGSCGVSTPRLNTFLELKLENQRLENRIHELRIQKAPFPRTLPTPKTLAEVVSIPRSNFGGNPLPNTSSVQPPVDPPPPTVIDHTEPTAANPSPVTRSFDVTGFQEGEQDEPAKKKVRCVRPSEVVDIIAGA